MTVNDPEKEPATYAPSVERATRESLFLGAEFERRGSVMIGRIRNVSTTGALLETAEDLALDERIIVSFRGVDRAIATVIRRTPKGFGLRFDTAVDPITCRQTVLAPKVDSSKDFILKLSEGFRRAIWDNKGEDFRRPGLD